MSSHNSKYQIYLVGGAVRDELLGLEVTDHDWVITGATPDQLLKANYQQVGKQFPVFLHPQSNDEYALARTEKKQGSGYTGFICDFSPNITLEEDLIRRDLTINAIAKTEQGEFIDPFNGQQDIENKILRHVSEAFIEDPLRVLRVARFAARFTHFGFQVAPETLQLMQKISHSGELLSLSKERVWKELEKALKYKTPESFFNILMKCNALNDVLPEFEWQLIDTLLKSKTIDRAPLLQLDSSALMWAFLCHKTHPEKLNRLHARLNCPNQYKLYANLTSEFMHNAKLPLAPNFWLEWLQKCNAIKKPQPYKEFVQLLSLITNTNQHHWLELREVVASVSSKALIQQGFKGIELGEAIKNERLEKLIQFTSPLIKKS